MKKLFIIILVSFIIFTNTYAQQVKLLKYSYNKENVVASAIEGKWKSTKKGYRYTFIPDSTVLKNISKKWFEYLKDKTIYYAGYYSDKKRRQQKKYPFILIGLNGNPHLVYFREMYNDPVGDAESFNLFIVKGKTKDEDILYVGGDFNSGALRPYVRVE